MGDFVSGVAWAAAIALLVFGQPRPAPPPAPVMAAPYESYCPSGEGVDIPAGQGVPVWSFVPCREVEAGKSWRS